MLLRAYEESLRGTADDIVVEIARRYTAGTVEGQHLTFAPSVAEFSASCRKLVDTRLAARAIPYREPEIAHEPILARQNRVRKQYSDRAILFENIDDHEFAAMVKRREIPAGSLYVAMLETVYAPEAA